uniref:(northern house mosquito) hypothetical protein n=1 Tax=Culex pipiens TaxID=7175 RepID=A0A8D8A939_CULPI
MLAIDGDLSRRAEREPGHHSDVDGQNHHGHRNGHTENVERGQIAEVDQQILQVVHVLVLLIGAGFVICTSNSGRGVSLLFDSSGSVVLPGRLPGVEPDFVATSYQERSTLLQYISTGSVIR